LIRQLLAFARRQPLQPRTVDIGALIRDAKPMLDRVLGEDVTLQSDSAPDQGPFLATVDPVGAESTLLNLCINARDAMPDGGTIKIHLWRVTFDGPYARANPDVDAGSYIVISVSDTGTGIPEEILPHLFEPFFTTKDVGRGTGLGLSMVYGFVKQSGGLVKVDSVVGRGTVVTLFFPEATDAAPAPIPNEPDEMPRGNGETILVVEDEPDLLVLAARFLEGLGYRVLPAASATVAIDVAAQQERIDLLLTDIVMTGGMNGRQLAAELREKRPGLSVLFMSGYSDDIAERRVARFGESAIIAKPYERSALAIAVRDALRPIAK
jgi:CheY-like chemotaxis protein